jgi:antitoxin (DNA-binding transcriptional repressor) of toxin-antitoxin stability system
MYIVHVKRYTVAGARQHLAQVLDEAEEGAEVVIERRGVRFAIRPMAKAAASKQASRVEFVDPEVEAGTWSWSWSEDGGLGLKGSSPKP